MAKKFEVRLFCQKFAMGEVVGEQDLDWSQHSIARALYTSAIQ